MIILFIWDYRKFAGHVMNRNYKYVLVLIDGFSLEFNFDQIEIFTNKLINSAKSESLYSTFKA